MPVCCGLDGSPECAELAVPLQPHPPTLLNRSICQIFLSSPDQSAQLLPLFFASRSVGEDITVMSAFNLLHLVTKSQPAALRACGLPSGSCRDKKNCKVVFSQQELRKRLTPLQYHVTQEKGTESAFEGEYTHHKDPGIYKCVVCGTPLFKSESKFDSGSGLTEILHSFLKSSKYLYDHYFESFVSYITYFYFIFSSFAVVLSCSFFWDIFLCLLTLSNSLFVSVY
ncbi:methionine-R-sulfoxide reductase B3 isoform X2 [Mirounga angustirostris]|uniref:methionine-R-sulfoxide reductase B3 isoform X2 n=1 Tax=Mirounga angustirostris TaxID=9716 RepID=UPI00313F2D23